MKHLNKCMLRLRKLVSPNAKFEIKKQIVDQYNNSDVKITGILDCEDGNNVWEFKCVEALSSEHKLQLAVYMHLCNPVVRKVIKKNKKGKFEERMKFINMKKYFLMNILTNQVLELKSSPNRLKRMMNILYKANFSAEIKRKQ